METTGNIVVCPSCGAENIEGVDTCENCLMDLRTVDVPVTHQVEGESDLLELLSSARLSKPRVMRPGATVREAVRVLAGEPTGAVVVADGDRVVGIFTERDVLKRIAAHQERLDDPTKRWKFRRGDLEERKRWDDYRKAYEDAIEKTSTNHAPWYVVPADRNWYRNLVVAQILVDTLEALDLRYPAPEEGLDGLKVI